VILLVAMELIPNLMKCIATTFGYCASPAKIVVTFGGCFWSGVLEELLRASVGTNCRLLPNT